MSFRRYLAWAFGLTLCVLLAGCSGSSSLDGVPTNGAFQPTVASTPTDTSAIGGSAAASAQGIFAANATSGGADNPDYRIAPLDVLEITVFGVQDLNRTVQVSSSGMISLPLIREVKAGGRTQDQLERAIAEKLQASYLQAPQVSVYIKEFNSQRITVDGAVNKPGIFPIAGQQVSLLQSIAMAQGITTVADPSGILLFRTVNKQRMAARFDLKMIRSGKMNDPMLQAGDIVMVDESSAKTTLRSIKDALPLAGLFRFMLL